MLKHISYSYLHLLACPYAAFLRYSAALKGPTTPWLALGNAIHYALEYSHYDNPVTDETGPNHIGQWDFDSSVVLFKREFQRIIETEQVSIGWPQIKKMEAEGIEMLGGYNVQVLSGVISSKPLALEEQFAIPFMGTEIVGRIDKLDDDIVTDFKTGQKEPTPWFLRHNLQLTTYAWAYKEKHGELPRKLVWHHLRNGKLLETVRTDEDIVQLQKIIENAIKFDEMGIRHRVFHEQVCGQCDYAGDTCDDPELEEQTLIQLDSGVRPDPNIVYRSRGW